MKIICKIKPLPIASLFLLSMFFINSFVSAQVYPAYVANVFDSAASVGYYFMSPKYSKSVKNPPGGYLETQMILDRYGELIYFHNFKGTRASDFKIQKTGIMTFIDNDEAFYMDSTFTYTDSVWVKNGILYDQHELQVLPNGNFLLIGAEKVTMDLSSYHMFMNNGTPGSKTAEVRCGVIQEQDANKNVVFEWHTKDYYDFADTDSTFLLDSAKVDWTHLNAVDVDPDGNILLSTRRMNEITKINRTNGNVMWRLGGKKNQFTFTNDTPRFMSQHDIRRIPNGNITMFDNGYRTPFQPCRAVEYSLDETNLIATKVWSYTYDQNRMSEWLGNVQRLPNGNTIVNYGNLDSSNVVFNLVNPAGVPIFEVRTLDTLNSYRSFAYPTLPWNLNRPKISCDQNGGQVYLSVDSGYSKYYWSTGDTVFKIAITTPGTYYVFVPRGSGGYLKSEKLVIASLTNPCPPCPIQNAQPGVISGSSSPCQGTVVNYSVTLDTAATSYTWTLPSGWSGSSSTNSISATVGSSSGAITVKANALCGSSPVRAKTINVLTIPAIPINIIGNAKPCPNAPYSYSVNPVAGATNYIWTFPSGWSGVSNTNSINLLTNLNGGTMSVKGSNACGTGLSRHKTITIDSVPAKPSVITGSQYGVCGKSNVSYLVTAVSGLTYNWSFDNTNASIATGQGSSTVKANFSSAYTSGSLSVTAAATCTSEKRSLVVRPVPKTPLLITGATTVCQNQQGVPYSISPVSGSTTYTWTGPIGSRFSDGITTSTTATFITASPSVTVNFKTTAGLIKVRGNNSCGSGSNKTLSVSFNCRDSKMTNPGNLFLSVAPNPLHDLVNVSFMLEKEEWYEIHVLDLTGRLLLFNSGKGLPGKNEKQIDAGKLSKGTYLLQLVAESGNSSLRLVVD